MPTETTSAIVSVSVSRTNYNNWCDLRDEGDPDRPNPYYGRLGPRALHPTCATVSRAAHEALVEYLAAIEEYRRVTGAEIAF